MESDMASSALGYRPLKVEAWVLRLSRRYRFCLLSDRHMATQIHDPLAPITKL